MKKLICLIFALALAVSMVACSSTGESGQPVSLTWEEALEQANSTLTAFDETFLMHAGSAVDQELIGGIMIQLLAADLAYHADRAQFCKKVDEILTENNEHFVDLQSAIALALVEDPDVADPEALSQIGLTLSDINVDMARWRVDYDRYEIGGEGANTIEELANDISGIIDRYSSVFFGKTLY